MPKTRLSIAKMARQLGVHRVTLYDWFERGCPRDSIEAIATWRLDNVSDTRTPHEKRTETREAMEEIANGEEPVSGVTAPKAKKGKRALTLAEKRLKADTEKIRAEVAYKQMRNQEKRKDLVSLTEVNREAAELAIRIKERLIAAPDEMETRFPAETRAQNKADFEEFIRQLLLEISTWRVVGDTMDDRIIAAAKTIEAKRQ